jgi:hypothetical protein
VEIGVEHDERIATAEDPDDAPVAKGGHVVRIGTEEAVLRSRFQEACLGSARLLERTQMGERIGWRRRRRSAIRTSAARDDERNDRDRESGEPRATPRTIAHYQPLPPLSADAAPDAAGVAEPAEGVVPGFGLLSGQPARSASEAKTTTIAMTFFMTATSHGAV